MKIFIIFPNQLFDISINKLNKYDMIYLLDEHLYFTGDIKPNKIKIAYLKSCLLGYYDLLKKHKLNVKYYTFDEMYNFKLNNTDTYYSYEITDHTIVNKYKGINEILTPMFLMSIDDLNIYNKRKTISHASFYDFTRKKLKILEDVKNQDIYNRKNPRKRVELDVMNFISNKKYYDEGIKFSNRKEFINHIGEAKLETLQIYPINSIDAYEKYEYFLAKKLLKFGEYQDVIQDDNPFMYHSIISPMLNNGLLEPLKLLEIIKKYKTKVPLSAYEGFIRQIIGWREYMRYIYLYKYNEIIKSNSFNNKNKLDKSWYNATTGLYVIDNEIKKAIKYGYAHHIVRLMIFLNFMTLNETDPYYIYKWFMEVISIDAYDWIMISNIYIMGYYSKIGMRRPYLSSSNYIIKMSNYKKDGKWDIIWDTKFRNFVKSRKISFYLRSII